MVAKVLRWFAKKSFEWKGHKTIFPIETDQFNCVVKDLLDSGWKKTYEYEGFDAWIDYGAITLRNDSGKLYFEWDNWHEGSIYGAPELLVPISEKYKLPIVDFWRWSVWDTNDSADA